MHSAKCQMICVTLVNPKYTKLQASTRSKRHQKHELTWILIHSQIHLIGSRIGYLLQKSNISRWCWTIPQTDPCNGWGVPPRKQSGSVPSSPTNRTTKSVSATGSTWTQWRRHGVAVPPILRSDDGSRPRLYRAIATTSNPRPTQSDRVEYLRSQKKKTWIQLSSKT